MANITDDINSDQQKKAQILKIIANEASYRPLVPFLGAGISVSAGFPTIKFVIEYLAKVDFAIQFGVFEDRFPVIRENQQTAMETYRRHPSKYLEDFGWPNYGQLNADIWTWLGRKNNTVIDSNHSDPYKGMGRIKISEDDFSKATLYKKYLSEIEKNSTNSSIPKKSLLIPDLLSNDITKQNPYLLHKTSKKPKQKNKYAPLDFRDHQLAIVQWILRKELADRENGTTKPLLDRWLHWKRCYFDKNNIIEEVELLYGDWEVLLDRLCEGNFNLVDTLFSSFEKGLNPTMSHRFLAFLKPKLGMPIILTTNFDSLLERAFQDEEILSKVFDIHRDAQLPSATLVHQQFSMIKLHGSAYGLRLGERLKYQLKADARNSILEYMPDNALMLVIGFNGSERRIMQMLQAIVGEGSFDNKKPRLIWIQGPSTPGPLFDELIKRSKGAVISCKVGHADTFLEELYFHMTRSSYQSSAKRYLTVPSRPLMMKLKELSFITKQRIDKKEKKRRPVQICVGKVDGKKPSSNWSSLAGMALTNSIGNGYTVIWIYLESHHTVEGIIAEFFDRIRLLDPQAPSCVITNMDKDVDAAIDKTLERISDVFKRGRYILVLDGVDSFGRPQMVHHGMTLSELDKEDNFEKQVNHFKKFLFKLIHYSEEPTIDFYWDSYVIVTADKLRFRHPDLDLNSTNEISSIKGNISAKKEIFDSIKESLKTLQHIDENKNPHISVFLETEEGYKELIKEKEIKPEDNLTKKLSPCWVYGKEYETKIDSKHKSKERSKAVLSLLLELRNPPQTKEVERKFKKQSIEAFICLLSVFRRPRSQPLIHSIIDRWALRKIGDTRLNDENSEIAHKAIVHLLHTISTVKNSVGVVSQNHEGGTVWFYREVYEATYDALTEHLRLRDWKKVVWKNGRPKTKVLEDAIIDGILNLTWHLYAARTYYVDVFLPSHDINAFYEYLYHRVSATKIITLLITILEKIENDDSFMDVLNNYCNDFCESYRNKPGLGEEINKLESFAWYVSVIGVFDPIGKEKAELTNLPNLIGNLKSIRNQAVETLLTSLNKNKLLFRSVATPDTIISWSNQFDFELESMQKIELKDGTTSNGEDIEETIIALRLEFKKLRFQAWLSKMDYESIISDYCEKGLLKPTLKKRLEEFTNAVNELKKSGSSEEWLIAFESVEIELEKLFPIVRCLVERCDQRAKKPVNIIYESLLEIRDERTEIQRKIKKHCQYALELKCRIQFLRWFYWETLLNRKDSSRRTEQDNKSAKTKNVSNTQFLMLQEAENDSVQYEDLLRVTTETNDADAKCRSTSLTLRARALYLRGHFQQAHHYLDLATTGFLKDRLDHKIYISIVHIIRAELLGISAHEHYFSLNEFDQVRKQLSDNYKPFHKIDPSKIELRELSDRYKFLENDERLITKNNGSENFNEFPKKIGEFAKILLPIAHSSLKKIERAEQELHQAETLLLDLSHHNIWLIYLEFGWAQIQIERMLYEIETLFLSWQLLSVTEYLQKSGLLEQKILKVMRRIRNVLDAIPYQSKHWKKIKGEEGSRTQGLLMFRIECGTYMLWRQLFVVGAYYSSLLNCLYQNSSNLNENTSIFDISEEYIQNIASFAGLTSKNSGKYLIQWKLWCSAMRFEHLSDTENMDSFDLLSNSKNENGNTEKGLKSLSLRASVIRSMIAESNDEKIARMWNIRRP